MTDKKNSTYIPDRLVAERYNVCVRTLVRWSAQPDLGFPPAILINKRHYREAAALDAWERRNARAAAKRRDRAAA